ncbi:MAG: hypothetical protein R3C03_11945 [Pirellulaceae bacterium]
MVVPDRTVTRVEWRELFPWLILFRSFSISASVTVIAFALLGVVATPIGWLLSETAFLNDDLRNEDAYFKEFVETSRSPYRGVFDASRREANYVEIFGAKLSGARAVYERTVMPFRMIFRGRLGIRKFWYLAMGCIWTIIVWSFSGLCISRHAMLRYARDESIPIDETFDFGLSRWPVCLWGFAACIGLAFLLCVPMGMIGLLMAFDWSAWLGGMLYFIVALCAIALSMLLFGLMFAWPLMITSVAAENQNSLDAVTRTFAYVYQRPLNYAMYGFLSLVFGGFCWLIISQIASSAISLGFWGTSWGANVSDVERIDHFIGSRSVILNPAEGAETGDPALAPEQRSAGLSFGVNLVRFFCGFVSTIAVAFVHGLFWTMASGVYLLMRKDVDEVELDEIYLDEDSRSYELPPLKSDEHGIPQIQPLDEYERLLKQRDENIDNLGE